MKTRTEFVEAYAERSGLSAEWATLGHVKVGDAEMIAMPCACGEDTCEGWAMVSATSVSSHLSLYAPEPLRSAYRSALNDQHLF